MVVSSFPSFPVLSFLSSIPCWFFTVDVCSDFPSSIFRSVSSGANLSFWPGSLLDFVLPFLLFFLLGDIISSGFNLQLITSATKYINIWVEISWYYLWKCSSSHWVCLCVCLDIIPQLIQNCKAAATRNFEENSPRDKECFRLNR